MKNQQQIYTVGHSNHSIDYFLSLLQSQHINCLIDVRSIPASSYSPQFNQRPLKNALKKLGIVYMHFQEEFGARQKKREVLDEKGFVNFKRFQATKAFQQGVERVQTGLTKGFTIALMCSEGNPLECHRFSMIANYLTAKGFRVQHILKDKTVATHVDLEKELMKKYAKKLPKPSLFEPDIDEQYQLKVAYQLHNKEIGWRPEK